MPGAVLRILYYHLFNSHYTSWSYYTCWWWGSWSLIHHVPSLVDHRAPFNLLQYMETWYENWFGDFRFQPNFTCTDEDIQGGWRIRSRYHSRLKASQGLELTFSHPGNYHHHESNRLCSRVNQDSPGTLMKLLKNLGLIGLDSTTTLKLKAFKF